MGVIDALIQQIDSYRAKWQVKPPFIAVAPEIYSVLIPAAKALNYLDSDGFLTKWDGIPIEKRLMIGRKLIFSIPNREQSSTGTVIGIFCDGPSVGMAIHISKYDKNEILEIATTADDSTLAYRQEWEGGDVVRLYLIVRPASN